MTTDAVKQFQAHLTQLERNQWLSPIKIRLHQFSQIQPLLAHAIKTVPYYQDRLSNEWLSYDTKSLMQHWRALPLLSRTHCQQAGKQLFSDNVPSSDLPVHPKMTSGSTGKPVMVSTTARTHLIWQLLTCRDHIWHERQLSGRLASIRFSYDAASKRPLGSQAKNWGNATRLMAQTGPAFQLSIHHPIEQQIAWLQKINPHYLITYPNNLIEILKQWPKQQSLPSHLCELRTFGEMLTASQRRQILTLSKLPLTDLYSSQEVGYIALQCPESSHYHLQSENVFVEVLNEDDQPCEVGEIGRIVITNLHNYATPLIRYDIGDYAEVGAPCECGRGLPVLNRIIGRSRNMLRLPTGEMLWPSFGADGHLPKDFPVFSQFQVRQVALDHLKIYVVRHAPFSEEENNSAIRYLRATLQFPFKIDFCITNEIQRGPTGKFEDFICELPEDSQHADAVY